MTYNHIFLLTEKKKNAIRRLNRKSKGESKLKKMQKKTESDLNHIFSPFFAFFSLLVFSSLYFCIKATKNWALTEQNSLHNWIYLWSVSVEVEHIYMFGNRCDRLFSGCDTIFFLCSLFCFHCSRYCPMILSTKIFMMRDNWLHSISFRIFFAFAFARIANQYVCILILN